MSEQQHNFIVCYEGNSPVELISFTNALMHLGKDVKNYAKSLEERLIEEEYKLHIKEVRAGSIIIELVSAAQTVLGVAGPESSTTLIEYARDFKSIYDYFIDKGKRPDNLNATRCKNIQKIVAPVAENSGSIMNMNIDTVNINIDSLSANAVQNRAIHEIEKLREQTSQILKEVLFFWQQAKKSPGVQTGNSSDKGIIEEVDDRARSVLFPENSRDLKDEMVKGEHNFFSKAYLIDVEVMTLRKKIVAYKILKLHDVIDTIDR